MTTFTGNQAVESGYYLNTSTFAIEPVAVDGERLPAGPGAWRRVPAVAALLATPVLGLAFLVFLPFIGLLLTLRALVGSVAARVERAGAKVEAGYYLSTSGWKVEVVPEGGGPLHGPAGARFLRLPFPVLFAVIPVIGLAFLVFLPFIGLALVAYALVLRVTGHVQEGATALAGTVGSDAVAGAAYLTGAKGEEKPAGEPHPELEQLEKEIESKRAR